MSRPDRSELQRRFAQVDLYPVTGQEHSAGRSSLEILDAVIAGGARVVQLREKSLSKRALWELALEFRRRTREAGLLLIVNDHLDVALAAGADGVHLGQDDLPVPEARRLAPHLLIGASTHSLDEALRAQREGADMINVGPVFATSTKATATAALGLARVQEILPHVQVPCSVMGGIGPENIDQVLALGVRCVAVVTAVTAATDPAQAVRALRARFRRDDSREDAAMTKPKERKQRPDDVITQVVGEDGQDGGEPPFGIDIKPIDPDAPPERRPRGEPPPKRPK